MVADEIAQVRRFNRLVTQRAGALNDHFLGRDRPLGESRLLYEIGEHGADLRDLRRRLGLDAGYVTRLVQALETKGLVRSSHADADQRVRKARLTAAGRRELREMNKRSDEVARAVLAPLSPAQRARMVTAMDEVCRLLLLAGLVIERVDPASPAARWCVAQYFAELDRRFESGFDASTSLPTPDDDFQPPGGAFLVASADGEPVACGAVRTIAPAVGYLKRMWVSEGVRGLGLGRRLLEALEEQARELGMTTLRLETNDALQEAIGLYRSAGFREVPPFNSEPYARHWFEKDLGRGSGR
jgi:DNA-binding MarR family transcriptional regulator/GNAT superfamily N-acetyltransferase